VKRDICERTFQFALSITRLCQRLLEKRGVARSIGKQVFDSGTYIGANVEEGQDAQSSYWLRLLVAGKICTSDEIGGLLKECDELIAILTTIIRKTKDRTK